MKIKYNVLWVEDDKSWYDTACEILTDNLSEQGFKLVSKRCVSFDEVKAINEGDGLKKYDMLLVDFTLRNSASGDEIINYFRSINIFTDVIFYSSAIEDVRHSMRTLGLEGVYTADRKHIEEKFNLVFNTTVKKIQEINAMRGLVVGETSELDVVIEELVIHLAKNVLNLSQDELNEIIEFYVDDFLRTKPDRDLKKYSEVGFDNYFHQIEASRKWRIFRDLLKRSEFKDDKTVAGFLEINKTYSDDVIQIRNKFAHAKSMEQDGKTILKGQIGKDHFECDDEKFVEIRHKLTKHSDNFEMLTKHFGMAPQ